MLACSNTFYNNFKSLHIYQISGIPHDAREPGTELSSVHGAGLLPVWCTVHNCLLTSCSSWPLRPAPPAAMSRACSYLSGHNYSSIRHRLTASSYLQMQNAFLAGNSQGMIYFLQIDLLYSCTYIVKLCNCSYGPSKYIIVAFALLQNSKFNCNNVLAIAR
jgi:hypothetical protein